MSAWGNNNADWNFDMPSLVEPEHFGGGDGGNIPPPRGARFEASQGLSMGAFPGIVDSGWGVRPGTPHPRQQVPPGWDYQAPPPPHTAPGAFYHPNLPHPSQMPAHYNNMPSPWAHAHGQGQSTFTPREDGFSSLAWRPPDYDMDRASYVEYGGGAYANDYGRGPPPGSAPPRTGLGLGFGAGGGSENPYTDQPMNSGGYFANAGRHHRSHSRNHSRSRQRQEPREDAYGWGAEPAGAWDEDQLDEEDEEEEGMRRARADLMRSMDRGHENATSGSADWDLIDSFSGMGIQDGQRDRSRHRGRSRSRSRHPDRHRRKSAMKRSYSNDMAPQASTNFNIEPHRSRERMDRLAWPSQNSPYGSSNRLIENQIYGPQDRVRRPRDWRAEYSVKPNIFTRFSPRQWHSSDVIEMNDPVKRVPNSLLHRTSSSHPPTFIDLRIPIQTQMQLHAEQRTHFGYGSGGIFPYLNRPPNSIDFAQMACEPASPHMRLYHPRLPWYIDLMSTSAIAASRADAGPSTPGFGVGYGVIGLTVWEVIEGVWRELQKQITSRDFYNEEMGTVMTGGRTRSTSLTSHSPFSSHMPLTPLSSNSALPLSPGHGYDMYGQPQLQPTQTARDLVSMAFRSRCKFVGQELFGDSKRAKLDFGHFGQGEAREMSKGVRRVDWLGMEEEWVWTGIVRKSSGMWEIKTRKA
ncbi:MAG: hypothetical protein NXY57DRAFT_6741 [Lentinula lateritia]|uniref:DUF6699 domain-containing protein n=1 Tax=Lentinula lateritia TaxID=40482 RepID=A0ABQ8VTD3_9AGAR|nr:MAG: hypothetical protein NXY57DRAFT_6741 [Lentinula lateritia]KAJ4499643.1 hypothetical protein C8R41DRAFT_863965 [Lentinula lateritia]